MPRVQTYQPQVDVNPAPVPTRQKYATPQVQAPPPLVTPSPAALGAGFGQSLERIGDAIVANETVRQDAVRLTQAERKLSDWELDRIYHPEHGALNQQGEKVYGLPDKLGEDFDKTSSTIEAGLNERQRLRYQQVAQARRAEMMGRVTQHVASESRRIDADETKAAVANETAITVANADDPSRIALGIDTVRRHVSQFAQRNGFGPEQTKRAVDASVSDLHVGVIGRYLDQGNDIYAKVYYEHAEQEIDGTERGKIEKALDTGSTAGDASRAATDIWAKLGPKTDTDVVSFDALATSARAMFPEDAKRAAAAIAELKERKLEFDAGAKDRIDKAESEVWQMALSGASLGDIQKTPQYPALDGKTQTSVAEHVADRLYSIEQRAKSAADYLHNRAWENESRTHTRKVWSKQEQEETAYAAYEEALADPQQFSKMSENQILGLLPTLGKTLTNDLLTKRKDLNSPDKIIKASLESDLFNEVAEDAGLNPYKTNKTKTDKARLGALRNYAMSIIDQEQRDKKQLLDRDRKKEIMDRAVLDVVVKPGLFFDTHKRVFEIGIADVPQADRQKIESRLKSTGLPFTEQDIIDAFVEDRQRQK